MFVPKRLRARRASRPHDVGGDAAARAFAMKGACSRATRSGHFSYRGRDAANRSADRRPVRRESGLGCQALLHDRRLARDEQRVTRGFCRSCSLGRAPATGLCLVRLTSQGDGLDSLRLPVAARPPAFVFFCGDGLPQTQGGDGSCWNPPFIPPWPALGLGTRKPARDRSWGHALLLRVVL